MPVHGRKIPMTAKPAEALGGGAGDAWLHGLSGFGIDVAFRAASSGLQPLGNKSPVD
jgi:hypothetical protein